MSRKVSKEIGLSSAFNSIITHCTLTSISWSPKLMKLYLHMHWHHMQRHFLHSCRCSKWLFCLQKHIYFCACQVFLKKILCRWGNRIVQRRRNSWLSNGINVNIVIVSKFIKITDGVQHLFHYGCEGEISICSCICLFYRNICWLQLFSTAIYTCIAVAAQKIYKMMDDTKI